MTESDEFEDFGIWTFALINTSSRDMSHLPLILDADGGIPGQAVILVDHPITGSTHFAPEEVRELFPLVWQAEVNDPHAAADMDFQSEIFLVCDTEDPEEHGLLVVVMRWDGMVRRSEEELREIGRSAAFTETRAPFHEALLIAKRFAWELDDQ